MRSTCSPGDWRRTEPIEVTATFPAGARVRHRNPALAGNVGTVTANRRGRVYQHSGLDSACGHRVAVVDVRVVWDNPDPDAGGLVTGFCTAGALDPEPPEGGER
jgi:hypothetical protein